MTTPGERPSTEIQKLVVALEDASCYYESFDSIGYDRDVAKAKLNEARKELYAALGALEEDKKDAERYRAVRPLLGTSLRLTGGREEDNVFVLPFRDVVLRTTRSSGYTDSLVDEAIDTALTPSSHTDHCAVFSNAGGACNCGFDTALNAGDRS